MHVSEYINAYDRMVRVGEISVIKPHKYSLIKFHITGDNLLNFRLFIYWLILSLHYQYHRNL